MNSTSIGIELVNAGWTQGADGGRVWHAYDDRQIRALTILVRDLIQRHGVAPENGGPQRHRAAAQGGSRPAVPVEAAGGRRHRPLVRQAGAAAQLARLQAEPLPAPAWFQQQLQRLGYASPQTGTLDRTRCITARRATTANPTLKPRQS